MKQNYHASISAKVTPSEAAKKINRVSDWWGKDFEGSTENVGDVFTIRFGETRVKFEVAEVVANKKLVWNVADCHLPWLSDKTEWKNTRLIWELSPENGVTRIDFTHAGLVPEIECYENCEKGWNFYINESLSKLLNENRGRPNERGNCKHTSRDETKNVNAMEMSNQGYLLLLHVNESWRELDREELEKYVTQNHEWLERLMASGKVKAGQALARSGAILSGKNGRSITDGPFAESKEVVGGYLLLDVETFEDAVAIAKTCPTLEYGGKVEVRPLTNECLSTKRLEELQREEELVAA